MEISCQTLIEKFLSSIDCFNCLFICQYNNFQSVLTRNFQSGFDRKFQSCEDDFYGILPVNYWRLVFSIKWQGKILWQKKPAKTKVKKLWGSLKRFFVSRIIAKCRNNFPFRFLQILSKRVHVWWRRRIFFHINIYPELSSW